MSAPPSPSATQPLWRRLLRGAYLVAVTVGLVAAIWVRRSELAAQLSGADVRWITAGALAGFVGVGLSAEIWRVMMAGLGTPLQWRPATRIFFLAQLGKYLPGSIWPVLAQAELGRDYNIAPRMAVAGQTFFMWVHLITGATIGIPALALTGAIPRPFVFLAPLFLMTLHPRALSVLLNWLLTKLGRAPLLSVPTSLQIAVASAWAVAMWLAYGLSVWCVGRGIGAPLSHNLLLVTGVFAAAWCAGFVFIIAPAGAGIREIVLIVGLAGLITSNEAFGITLVSRIVLTVADGAWAGIGAILPSRGHKLTR